MGEDEDQDDDDGEDLLGRLWDKYVPVMVEMLKRLTQDVWLEEEKMRFCSFVILSQVDIFLSSRGCDEIWAGSPE